MDTNGETQPTITLRMLHTDKQWAVIYQGQEIGQMSYHAARPFILGQRPKTELLERYGVEYDPK